ncbi:hypothetical protein LTR70_003814 [Exophiala xenobiotica]|uniref:Peptidase A1 domain-containing protein n=1 Tax=Lithohypha guttulata TaxID=1690604 RepID=A0ABR0KG52_9EURO|nr:hypothetical protein LTR24_003319 [Lithohypha guttulata]KAK5322312.1 hypothetical protein LTR70_003814 [Exophiala xenobiotica]
MALQLSTCIVGGIELVQLPITKNRVSVSSAASKRGIAFSIGADSQLFSVMPYINENNTFLTHVNACGSKDNASCVASYGGVYTPPEGVQATAEPANWNGTASWHQQGDADGYDDLYLNDVMKMAGFDIPGLPIYTYTESATGSYLSDWTPPYLEAAFKVGMVGTRQWSLWTGTRNEDVDGLLVLGGYDEARVAGEFTAFEVNDERKRPYLQITGIEWARSKQDSVNLMPNNTKSLWALPEPYTSSFYVPEDSYFKFVELANSSGDVTFDRYYNDVSLYRFYSVPEGEVIITLNNGMETTIPLQDLFYHPYNYTEDGIMQTLNDSYYLSLLWPDQSSNGLLYLGQPFMDQKMFVADWDAGKFYMADVVRDELAATNIKLLCTPPTITTPRTTATPPRPDSGPDIPAIAGGVAGGVGGLLVIGLVAWFMLKRKKKAKQQAIPEMSESSNRVSAPPPKYATAGTYPISEAPERCASPPPQHMPPQEMASPPRSPPPQVASHMQSPMISQGPSSGHWSGQPADPSYNAPSGFTPTSGPLEMPADYDERSATSK